MENVALHRLKTNACPKSEVPTNQLGNNARSYRARDYSRYQGYKPENQTSGSETDDDHVMNLGIGQNIFQGLDRVSAPDLFKPDILHIIYLGLFKHIMDWIEAFLKKHGALQAFDEVWKALPPYLGFLVPKKGYREVIAVARERDEESGALYSGSSGRGLSPARRCARNTFQTCLVMNQGTR